MDIWDIIKKINMYIKEVPEREEKGTEILFGEILTPYPNLRKIGINKSKTLSDL